MADYDAVASVLAWHHDYRFAFAALLIPALLCLRLVLIARKVYPNPEALDKAATEDRDTSSQTLPRSFWFCLAAASLAAAGFADYPLMAFHFLHVHQLRSGWIPLLYALARGVSGGGSLLFGRLFDRFGFQVIIALTLVGAAFAPFVFFGGVQGIVIGVCIWGLPWASMSPSSRLRSRRW